MRDQNLTESSLLPHQILCPNAIFHAIFSYVMLDGNNSLTCVNMSFQYKILFIFEKQPRERGKKHIFC